MRVLVASDHGGFELKNSVVDYLKDQGYDVEDLGPQTLDPGDDYPFFAQKLTAQLLDEPKESKGILLCRGGQGMAMAANRKVGIRAAVCWNDAEARMTRVDNDANVLSIPTDHITQKQAMSVVTTFLTTKFSGGVRHIRRIHELDEL